MGNIIINKHYKESSSITENVFASHDLSPIKKYREGEIVISNDKDNPGLYIIKEEATASTGGVVINVTSPKYSKLSSEYQKSTESGETLNLQSGDSVEESFEKIERKIDLIPTGSNVWDGTKEEYDALETKSDDTTYFIHK